MNYWANLWICSKRHKLIAFVYLPSSQILIGSLVFAWISGRLTSGLWTCEKNCNTYKQNPANNTESPASRIPKHCDTFFSFSCSQFPLKYWRHSFLLILNRLKGLNSGFSILYGGKFIFPLFPIVGEEFKALSCIFPIGISKRIVSLFLVFDVSRNVDSLDLLITMMWYKLLESMVLIQN